MYKAMGTCRGRRAQLYRATGTCRGQWAQIEGDGYRKRAMGTSNERWNEMGSKQFVEVGNEGRV